MKHKNIAESLEYYSSLGLDVTILSGHWFGEVHIQIETNEYIYTSCGKNLLHALNTMTKANCDSWEREIS